MFKISAVFRGSRNLLPALKHESILTTVGKTPLVKLSNRINPTPSTIYVKYEAMNPMGSVKDRLALGVIEWAERSGEISPGQTVVECTSGNTGIGLAMVCAAKGYPLVCVMSESFSIERRKLMRFLGAKVVLTNPAHKGSGMVIKANELAEEHGWFLPKQFENEANAWIHSETTGPEILEALSQPDPDGNASEGSGACSGEDGDGYRDEGSVLDHFFVSYGTGGTMKGVATHFRQASPGTKVHVCEPDNAPLLYSNVKSEWNEDGTVKSPHPLWRPHLLQGWAPDFVPKLVESAVEDGLVDRIVHVGGDVSMATSKELAQKEGIFTGTSGGGCLSAALEFCADVEACPPGSTVVAMLPDTGERYLSTPLFADIPADMTEEEQMIADSTPSAAPPAIDMPPVTEEALAFVRSRSGLGGSGGGGGGSGVAPVVVWSLEYCEFCWTAFGLFDAVGLSRGKDYAVYNIDAFEYAKDNQGNKYRSALASLNDVNTFPQIYIGGKFIGGAADACMMWKSGELQLVLQETGLEPSEYEGDPFEFLPKWMTANPLRSA